MRAPRTQLNMMQYSPLDGCFYTNSDDSKGKTHMEMMDLLFRNKNSYEGNKTHFWDRVYVSFDGALYAPACKRMTCILCVCVMRRTDPIVMCPQM